MRSVSRREMLGLGAAGAGVVSAGSLIAAAPDVLRAQAAARQKPPPLDKDMVKMFVGAAHGDLEKAKAILAEEPRLVNAAWDWGGGDFETALGGASHMGRPDIASYLLANGARMDLFCATMMGKAEIVAACIADNPAIVNVKGPHGISLLRHAQAGKQDALVAILTAAGAV